MSLDPRRPVMPGTNRAHADATLEPMSAPQLSPTVTEVLQFEDLPLGSHGTRRAIVRWSDGSEGEALSGTPTRS
jgi:hypothetical protein